MLDQIYSFLEATFVTGSLHLLGYAVVLVLLESLWPAKPDQPRWRRDSKLDIVFSFLVPLISVPLYFLILKLVINVLRGPATNGILVELHRFTSAQNYALQIFAAIFIADFVGYWRHRMFHTRYLWPFHAIHHSSEQVDWLSNERFHPFNALIGGLMQTLVLLVLGFGPDVVAINALARRAYSIFEHANVKWSYGVLDYVLVSPLFHRWHHSDDPRAANKNYANFFSLFDLIFGTYYFPAKEDPESFGLCRARIEGGFFTHFFYPFKQLLGSRNWEGNAAETAAKASGYDLSPEAPPADPPLPR